MTTESNSNGHATSVPAPRSVAEVQDLVQQLYRPNPPALIAQINEQLQRLQLSDEGWKLADELLGSDDANVRFFGALTFTVKLNHDGHSLDMGAALTLLARLLYFLVHLTNNGEGGMVCKKLCSTLTTYFIKSPVLWERPLFHLALCFHHGSDVGPSVVRRSDIPMPALVSSLKPQQLVVLLWFAATLAEDMGKTDTNSHEHRRRHMLMEEEVQDVSVILHWAFQQTGSPARAEALQTFLTWINYAQPVWPRKPDALQHLRNLIRPAAECLSARELSTEALDIFRDILESYTSFFQPQHMTLLAEIIHSDIRQPLERALFQKESDGQHVLYGQFVIAFGCANIQQVVGDAGNQLNSQQILDLHLEILSAEGYPGDDDQLSIQSIEFWNTYIEYVNDTLFSKESGEPDPAWLPQTKRTLQQAFHLFWKKLITPPPEVAQDWGEDEHAEFKEFRLDAADLLLSIFVLLGNDMLQQIVQLFEQALQTRDWHAVEASLFCLNTLADNVLEVSTNETELDQIFRSSLFKQMTDFSLPLPAQTRRTAIDTLGCYADYIERHAEFLPDSLRFLFASLETAGLANAAAKSISSLCSTCRVSLTNELPDFLAQYQRFLQSSTSDAYTKEKVIGAIAAITQAIKPESAKVQPLLALLEEIEKDVAAAKQYAAAGEADMVEVMGITALECLASIGKGLQEPDDVPIDIYEDGEATSDRPKASSFWLSEAGLAVQQRIVGCFSVLQVVGSYSGAIEAACQVLKAGYTETEPGPFVLPSSVTVDFLQSCALTTPQLETVLGTAGIWLTHHSRPTSPRVDAEVRAIHASVVAFSRALGQASADPSIAQSCIDLFVRLLPRYTHILLGEDGDDDTATVGDTLDFILSALIAPDHFPKRAACDFWAKFLKPSSAALGPATRTRMNDVTVAFGPKLASCLVFEMGGSAQRSELDALCEPLRQMLLMRGEALGWLEGALMGDVFPASAKVGRQERGVFLRQLGLVKGDAGKVREVVKRFWALSRGTVRSYS